MKYSTAAFTLALALLAANNDVADARVNLRSHKAGHRRLRHLKNTDSTGDDALNRATPAAAVPTTVTAAFIIDEDVIKKSKEKSGDEDAVVEESTIVKEDTVTSQKSISVPKEAKADDGAEAKKKSHKAQIENMADTAATSDGEKEECKGKKCPETEDNAAARADEIVPVKTPKSLRGSDVATDETAVAEDEKESGKGKNGKKKGAGDAEDDADAAARADADGETTEESGKASKKKKEKKEEEEEEEATETRAEEDAETEIVVDECHGKKCNKKNIDEAKADDEEIVMVALDKIVACEGKGCKSKIANVAGAVAEAIEGSIEVKASKMKASKISKISGDEAEAMVADVSDIAKAVKKGKKSENVEVKEDEIKEDEVEEESPKSKKSHAGAAENLVVGESSNISEQIAREDDTR